MFLLKNKELFHLHNTELKRRNSGTTMAKAMKWRKEHSRRQAKYQGQQLFDKLPAEIRGERRLRAFKRKVKSNK
jgi:hypothetical protein